MKEKTALRNNEKNRESKTKEEMLYNMSLIRKCNIKKERKESKIRGRTS